MPEGDSLYRFAEKLRPVLLGKVLREAEAHGPGAIPRVDRIIGSTITGVESHGKNVLIGFDNGLTLRSHLRMYGTWHIYTPGQRWRRAAWRARLVLQVDGALAVNFDAPVIELLETRALEQHRPVSGLGPDLIAGDFDPEAVFRLFRSPSLADDTIGDAVMAQEAMAGAGNIWKHEILFRRGLNPWLLVHELSDDELRGLVTEARTLLRASVGLEQHERLPEGRRPTFYAYGRWNRPCRRCFTRMRRDRQGRDIRFTVWCPRCQPVRPGQQTLPPFMRRNGPG